MLKIVTGWGLPAGWTDGDRRWVQRLAPSTIVRTVAGDPSIEREEGEHGYGPFAFPHPERVVSQVEPWWDARDPARPFLIEIGNEPLIDPLPGEAPAAEYYAWQYRHYLAGAIAACRAAFPGCRLIAPAHTEDHPIQLGDEADGQARMTEIMADVLRQCDMLGLHAYSMPQYVRGLGRLRAIVGDQPVALTEFALNEPLTPTARARAYHDLLRQTVAQIACLYHLDELGGTDPAHFQAAYRLDVPTLAALAELRHAPPTPLPSPIPPRPLIANVAMTREHLTRGRAHGRVQALVIHATAGRHPHDYHWLRAGGNERSPVSTHYYISKSGDITQFVADHDTAWHAGKSSWRGLEVAGSLNARSIGIELENTNTGSDLYPPAQIAAAVALSRYLMAVHGIDGNNLVRHLDISPGRKTDPAGFPWRQFVIDVLGG